MILLLLVSYRYSHILPRAAKIKTLHPSFFYKENIFSVSKRELLFAERLSIVEISYKVKDHLQFCIYLKIFLSTNFFKNKNNTLSNRHTV